MKTQGRSVRFALSLFLMSLFVGSAWAEATKPAEEKDYLAALQEAEKVDTNKNIVPYSNLP